MCVCVCYVCVLWGRGIVDERIEREREKKVKLFRID